MGTKKCSHKEKDFGYFSHCVDIFSLSLTHTHRNLMVLENHQHDTSFSNFSLLNVFSESVLVSMTFRHF